MIGHYTCAGSTTRIFYRGYAIQSIWRSGVERFRVEKTGIDWLQPSRWVPMGPRSFESVADAKAWIYEHGKGF